MDKYKNVVDFIRTLYKTDDFIPLHAPVFYGNEKKYLNDCIDSTFVSSVGKYVDLFENRIADFTGAKKAIAVVNGTSALHAALRLVGVQNGDEVITQPLTFIATCNAISYCGASPVFVDVDIDTMGLSPKSLSFFLDENCEKRHGKIINIKTGNRVSACVPMHTFGHPVRIKEIADICQTWHIPLIEDAAESLGSYAGDTHTGLFGKCGILSFNGNKTITTGAGGMIITNDEEFGNLAKHITTTAKVPHEWEFNHDMIGFNYRMPNLNAALGCAQLETLPTILETKRVIAEQYSNFFKEMGIDFIQERASVKANYWLNAVKMESAEERNAFLQYTNSQGIMTRPIWTLMNKLNMFKDCFIGNLDNSHYLEERILNIPSGVNR
ncbi:MAG: LegC family aminotransferase [Spirochaetaceae bacterium]|nr:LegC family aminotransferase [Spirochaetaceae bacterium]